MRTLLMSIALMLLAVSLLHNAVGGEAITSPHDSMICQKLLGEGATTLLKYDEKTKAQALTCEVDGKNTGPYTSFYPNKNIHTQGQMCDGEMCGTWKRYYTDRKMESTGDWDRGMPHGYWLRFDKKRQKREEGFYVKGVPSCGLKRWDKKGNLTLVTTDCYNPATSPRIVISPIVGFSALKITELNSGLTAQLASKLNTGIALRYWHPVHSRISLLGDISFLKMELQNAEGGQSFTQNDNTVAQFAIGARFNLLPSLGVQIKVGRTGILVLSPSDSASMKIDRVTLSAISLGTDYKLITFKKTNISMGGEYSLLLGNTEKVEITGGSDFLFQLTASPDFFSSLGYSLTPWLKKNTANSPLSEQSNLQLGIQLNVEIRIK